MRFSGKTYDRKLDHDRLATQLLRVMNLMWDGEWRTLAQIAMAAGGSEAGVSARLRDLRKKRCGRFVVQTKRLFGGLFIYKLGKGYHGKPGSRKRKSRCWLCNDSLEWFQVIRINKHPKKKAWCLPCAKRA